MTPKQLHKLASKLGEGWQTKLALLLPCNARTVRRWLKGEREISPMVAGRIRQVIAEQKILKIRGSYDAPGFDACVAAELSSKPNN